MAQSTYGRAREVGKVMKRESIRMQIISLEEKKNKEKANAQRAWLRKMKLLG